MKVYCNGDFCDKEKLTEIFEPGFLFGWEVCEGKALGGEMVYGQPAFIPGQIKK